MPLMVRWFVWVVPLTVRVTVTLEEVTEELFTTNSFAPFPESLVAVAVPTPALNRHPAGAVRMRVLLLCAAKSLVVPSWITILPKVVKTLETPFWALSAGRPAPPVAGVTATFPKAVFAQNQTATQGMTNAHRLKVPL